MAKCGIYKFDYRFHLYKRINSEKYINEVLKNVGVVAESLMRQDADIYKNLKTLCVSVSSVVKKRI